ncbi:DNA-binding transcriptional ArsR family regulator [Amycolatopsis bartoniae]|uniref:Transcriptional regulator n=1 Tax=Amycolatopsis bartoniae TaxID=941986 RepID=A0A8H9MBH6_9PSEU|nr:ArsR family transcriptional regulator [Amycolatopsis bartoniae]MBB2939091.1 DNA-binding transcriptional ArsR family regulator [Amycolatopsis bartoniae]TVT06345.1 helix-turn-helix transcriptional regulator [Amycolatopsis bartoniae]GHF64989.1 transcriptional regulator [Amycolatopsis bartoniae]
MPNRPQHPDLRDVRLVRVLSALGDPARLLIMKILADGGEHQRGEFEVDVGPSTLSHHMKTLREAGLTHHRMEGTRCFVSLREDTRRRFSAVLDGVLRIITAEENEGTL